MKKIWTKNYPNGVIEDVDLMQYSSFVDLFEESFKKYSDDIAFENMGKSITYKELDNLSKNFSNYLTHELKLKKGDRLAIQSPNVLQYPVALFGALRSGIVVVNTNPLYTPDEMRHQFKDSGCKAILILSNFAHNLQKVIQDTEIKHVIISAPDSMLESDFEKKLLIARVQTEKILSDDSILITATAVRIPVMGGHSESVNVEFSNPFDN